METIDMEPVFGYNMPGTTLPGKEMKRKWTKRMSKKWSWRNWQKRLAASCQVQGKASNVWSYVERTAFSANCAAHRLHFMAMEFIDAPTIAT